MRIHCLEWDMTPFPYFCVFVVLFRLVCPERFKRGLLIVMWYGGKQVSENVLIGEKKKKI